MACYSSIQPPTWVPLLRVRFSYWMTYAPYHLLVSGRSGKFVFCTVCLVCQAGNVWKVSLPGASRSFVRDKSWRCLVLTALACPSVTRTEVLMASHIVWNSLLNSFIAVSLLGCDAEWTCRSIPTFRRNVLPPSSGPNGVTTQKTNDVFTAVITSYLCYFIRHLHDSYNFVGDIIEKFCYW
jgi:hypothetical protein